MSSGGISESYARFIPSFSRSLHTVLLHDGCIPTNSAFQCSMMAVTICILSTSSPAFIICRFFDNGHSDWCEVEAFSCNDSHLKGLYTHTCDLDSFL